MHQRKLIFFLFSTGHGGWSRPLRTGMRLVVIGSMHVRNAVRRNSVLRGIANRNVRQNNESQGLRASKSRTNDKKMK